MMDVRKSAEHLATAHNAMQQISAMLTLHALALAEGRVNVACDLLAQIHLTLLKGQAALLDGMVSGDAMVALAFKQALKTCHPTGRPAGATAPLHAGRVH